MIDDATIQKAVESRINKIVTKEMDGTYYTDDAVTRLIIVEEIEFILRKLVETDK